MEIRLIPCKNLCRIFPWRTPLPIPSLEISILRPLSLILGTLRRRIDRNSESLGEILPKRYTTLSEHAGKKHDHRCHSHTKHQSIHQRFQGDLISNEILSQIGDTEMMIRSVIQGKQYGQRNQAQVKDQSFFAVKLHRIQECRHIGDHQEHRMVEPYGKCNGRHKIYQVYHRMVTVKSHLRPHPSFHI